MVLVASLALSGSTIAFADQRGKQCPDCPMNCPGGGAGQAGGGGWFGGPYGRIYDVKTVQTVKGAITEIQRVAPMRGMSEGVHITLKTDQGVADVHLGPAWYLDHQDTQLAVGDHVDVRGSRVMLEGKPVVIAAEVKKGGEVLKLRDDQGLPMWRGWR
jgi:hypothetical protein